MSSYRCFFLDATNHVAADQFIECDTDELVQARSDELLADTEYPIMEVWDGARFVCQAMQHSGRQVLNRPLQRVSRSIRAC
jgi:hypothetical protein